MRIGNDLRHVRLGPLLVTTMTGDPTHPRPTGAVIGISTGAAKRTARWG
ncbi:MAG: hypothetical protein WKF96_04655 [Solirubrobacteraceae bacterium]